MVTSTEETMSRDHSRNMSRAIKRFSLSEFRPELPRERIVNGEYKEGDQLIQETFAHEYEISGYY